MATEAPPGELHVPGHEGDSLGVDGAEVGVLEQTDHVGLSGFLESVDSCRLESEVRFVVTGDLSDKALEWKFSNEELGTLLVSPDLTERDGAWSESVRLLNRLLVVR